MALRDRLLEMAAVDADDLDAETRAMEELGTAMMFGPIVAAWGRRRDTGAASGSLGTVPDRTDDPGGWLGSLPLFAAGSGDELARVAALSIGPGGSRFRAHR